MMPLRPSKPLGSEWCSASGVSRKLLECFLCAGLIKISGALFGGYRSATDGTAKRPQPFQVGRQLSAQCPGQFKLTPRAGGAAIADIR
jgi:hypothetical protein